MAAEVLMSAETVLKPYFTYLLTHTHIHTHAQTHTTDTHAHTHTHEHTRTHFSESNLVC